MLYEKPACLFYFVATLLFAQSSYSQVPDSITFLNGFKNPSTAYAPRVWWHWTASNITKEGITKDLEWMKRIGIGGFQAFDVSFGSGQSVNKKIKYMTPEWIELIKHTANEADRLGLEMTMVTAAGWSETGGITVKPAEAMKKIVWSQLQVQGGKKIIEKLPLPPSVTGPIRNLKKPASFFGTGAPDPVLYQDQFVLAYKTPEAELINDIPVITNHKGETVSSKELLDDNLNSFR